MQIAILNGDQIVNVISAADNEDPASLGGIVLPD